MSQILNNTQQENAESDVINLWADDDLFQEEEIDLIKKLQSTRFESVQKTLFYKLCGLIIIKLEGKINENDFNSIIKDFLIDYTENYEIINKLTAQVYSIEREIKNYATGDNYYGNENIKTTSKTNENIRRKIVFYDAFEADQFQNLLHFSDFSLINKVELALYAVMLEMGFNKFNQNIRAEIEIVRQGAPLDLLPAYRKGINLVINHTIYMTNRTYGILYNKFYNRVLKQFIDRI